jgi:hypothetical protein
VTTSAWWRLELAVADREPNGRGAEASLFSQSPSE